jgi:decaprenylphospho-beta-D-erythro-pentofuranosid-2-ulose 2-reductase
VTASRAPLRVVILGAASAIAEAAARLYAAEGAALALVGRRRDRLEQIAADLRLRGAAMVEIAEQDLADAAGAEARFARIVNSLGGADHVLVAYGILGGQSRAESDLPHAQEIIAVNFTSAAGWALAAAAFLEAQGKGSLVVLGSAAGDRGRRSNYVYGAAKAGIAVLVEGIAHRFAGRGPRAVLVKPGLTDTPMTAAFTKRGLLWSKPEQVAKVVRTAADRGGPVVYAPWFWRWIMLAVKMAPQALFNRINI